MARFDRIPRPSLREYRRELGWISRRFPFGVFGRILRPDPLRRGWVLRPNEPLVYWPLEVWACWPSVVWVLRPSQFGVGWVDLLWRSHWGHSVVWIHWVAWIETWVKWVVWPVLAWEPRVASVWRHVGVDRHWEHRMDHEGEPQRCVKIGVKWVVPWMLWVIFLLRVPRLLWAA